MSENSAGRNIIPWNVQFCCNRGGHLNFNLKAISSYIGTHAVSNKRNSGEMALTLCVVRPKFPALTMVEQDAVKKYLAKGDPGEVAQDHANMEVKVMDIKTLAPETWLNDQIINFYRVLIQERCNGQKLGVWLFRTNFYSTLEEQGYDKVKRWTKTCKPNIFSKKLVIIPILCSGSHWCCGVINFGMRRFEVYDSKSWLDKDEFGKQMLMYLREEHPDKMGGVKFDEEKWTAVKCDCPQQDNGFDCGVFTSHFMRCLALNKRVGDRARFDFGQSDISYLRKRMILDIVNKEILGEAAER